MQELAKSSRDVMSFLENQSFRTGLDSLRTEGWFAAFIFIVAFSWPIQVIFNSPVVGLMAYLPLFVLIASELKNIKRALDGFSWFDAVFIGGSFLVVAHSIFYLVTSPSNSSFHLKWMLVFGSSAFVYLYVAKSASLQSIRYAIIAVIAASAIISIHWLYESYAKTVLREISWYAIESIRYVLIRNNYDMEQLNSSIASVDYRAYGLLDKHTTTSAYIALGIFGGLAFSFSKRLPTKIAIYTVGLVVLFVGLGMTALLGYLLLAPVLLLLCAKPKQKLISFVSPLVATTLFFAIVTSLSATNTGVGTLLDHRWLTFRIQLHTLFNFGEAPMETKYGNITTSFPKVYKRESIGFAGYLKSHPAVALIGEGVGDNSELSFQRGGDLGLMEFFVAFGIPLSVLLVVASLGLVGLAVREIVRAGAPTFEHQLLLFSLISVVFLMMTLGHYNTVFKKEVLPVLMLALGLLRRFMPQQKAHR